MQPTATRSTLGKQTPVTTACAPVATCAGLQLAILRSAPCGSRPPRLPLPTRGQYGLSCPLTGVTYTPGEAMKLYRATSKKDEHGIPPNSCWTPDIETARAYQDNPGYGG